MWIRAALTPAASLLALAAPAAGAPVVESIPLPEPKVEQVAPGIVHQRIVQSGPQVIHVVRALRRPKVGLSPVLVAGATGRRGALSTAVTDGAPMGAAVGVNGDFFNTTWSYPSGLTVTTDDGLASEPEPTRSALVMDPEGGLSTMHLEFTGTWTPVDADGGDLATGGRIAGMNRPPERGSEVVLYTPAFGNTTPTGSSRSDVVVRLTNPSALRPNVPMAGVVVALNTGGGTTLQKDGVVLTGVGAARRTLVQTLPLGTRVRIDPTIEGLPADALAIGGGPRLVENGKAVNAAGEGFSIAQLTQRTARTAVGVGAQGTWMIVAAEGPAQGSRGLTVAELARLMDRLGSETAFAMDAGGSAQLVLDGRHAVPWSSPRSITTALLVTYRGVRVAPVVQRLTPNGDGVDDRQTVEVTANEPGRLIVTLTRRRGSARRTLFDGPVEAGRHPVGLNPKALKIGDGRYRITAELAPSGGDATLGGRSVLVDRTLGNLHVRPTLVRVGRRSVPRVRIRFTLSRPARVTVRARDSAGRVRAVIARNRLFRRGTRLVLWGRRLGTGYATGTYTFEVVARTRFGRPGLTTSMTLGAVPRTRTTAPGG